MSEGKQDALREMLNVEQVLARVPITRARLSRYVQEGLFPMGYLLAPNTKLWFADEVIAWQKDFDDPTSTLAQLIRQRQPEAPTTPEGER